MDGATAKFFINIRTGTGVGVRHGGLFRLRYGNRISKLTINYLIGGHFERVWCWLMVFRHFIKRSFTNVRLFEVPLYSVIRIQKRWCPIRSCKLIKWCMLWLGREKMFVFDSYNRIYNIYAQKYFNFETKCFDGLIETFFMKPL